MLFTLASIGGYSRNMRFGMNKIEWRPKGNPPQTDREWEEKYEDFKKFPEYMSRGQPTTLDQFKTMWKLNQVGKILGPGTMFVHLLPMVYFLARGYMKGPMKKFCLIYSGLFAAIGLGGLYMDTKRPGQVEGEPMPPKDPYMKALHLGLIVTYFGYGFWMALNLLRKGPDNVQSLDRYFGNMSLRKHLMSTSHIIFPLVIITGALMAGFGAGRSIVTYPKMGDKWVPTSEDLDKNSSFLENMYSNPKILHFNHRTLGTLFTGIVALQWAFLMRSPLGFSGKLGFTILLTLFVGQIHFGSYMTTHRMQPEQTWMHVSNSYLIMATFLYLMHMCRKPNPAIIKKIVAQIKETNPNKYERLSLKYPKEMKNLPK